MRSPESYFAESTRVLAAEYSSLLRKARRRVPLDVAAGRASVVRVVVGLYGEDGEPRGF